MKFFLVILVAVIIISCYSCNNSVFNEYHEFPMLEWKQDEVPEFQFEIKDDTSNYDIYITLRYVEGFPYKNMFGSMLITNENNTASINKFKFQVVDNNQDYIGDVAGNIFDIETLLIKDTNLTKGKYKLSIEQTTAKPSLAFVMDTGVIVKKSE